MKNEPRLKQSPSEVAVTFRLPLNLRERAAARIAGRYASTSEYIRDLIRRDLEGDEFPAAPATLESTRRHLKDNAAQ